MRRYSRRDALTGIVKGAVAGVGAGLVAAFAMNQFQSLISNMGSGGENQETEQSSRRQAESEPATARAATAISERVFSHRLSDQEKKIAEPAVHYAFAATMGGVYGALTEVAPVASTGFGVPFGAALWLVADETAVPLMGLSKPPTQYPISSHGYALASHCVYGVTLETVRRVITAAL